MRTIVCKMHPKNNFGPDILGETGCVNCLHPIHEGKCAVDEVSFTGNKGYNWSCGCTNPQPKKTQTIRDKKIEVGQKIAIWEMWLGMRKGIYCTKCFFLCDATCCDCNVPTKLYPRKLLDAEITECVPIEMKLRFNAGAVIPYLTIRDKRHADVGGYAFFANDKQHPFVKADTPSWDNRQFIDFFIKQYPKVKSDWIPMWIWKWEAKP